MKTKRISNQYGKRCTQEKHVDLLLIVEEGKRQYLLFKDYTTLMYDYTFHHGIKHFCCYCLQALSAEDEQG